MAFYEDTVEVMLGAEQIQKRIAELGAQITADYRGKDLTLVGIMKGSIFFLTDLARHVDLPCTIELMGVSSYQGGTETTGEVRVTHDVTKPMHGRHVLLVEDIVDTGLTMKFLLDNMNARNPASVKVATLLEKPSRAKVKVTIDYKGFVIEDRFVVGYGLDYGEKYRNLPFVGVLRTD
ncbi:MAG: hypoxanthine phosphoribosyltransferase [Archangium gephyra]|uniref:Hypoxanthine phosphoribosyltransferase n=1 Tax=Archangium gephyra TaxID=48 RepID=A0A2W5VJD8_9BACT|nr:MAG: hypoxanthine phosphoribosyltransferase [Archangium gephyra]